MQFYLNLNWNLSKIRLCMDFKTIPNGGWHLSYFGDTGFISNKIKNFGHQEYNSEQIINNLESKISKGLDIFNRPIDIQFIPIELNKYLPPNYLQLSNFIVDTSLNYLSFKYHLDKK